MLDCPPPNPTDRPWTLPPCADHPKRDLLIKRWEINQTHLPAVLRTRRSTTAAIHRARLTPSDDHNQSIRVIETDDVDIGQSIVEDGSPALVRLPDR